MHREAIKMRVLGQVETDGRSAERHPASWGYKLRGVQLRDRLSQMFPKQQTQFYILLPVNV